MFRAGDRVTRIYFKLVYCILSFLLPCETMFLKSGNMVCDVCNNEQTMLHLLFECNYVRFYEISTIVRWDAILYVAPIQKIYSMITSLLQLIICF